MTIVLMLSSLSTKAPAEHLSLFFTSQEVYGYLPLEVQREIAEQLDIPLAEVYGVVSFYTPFSINPKGKYKINICMGTACYVKGTRHPRQV